MQAFAESSSSTSGGGLIGVEPMPLTTYSLTLDPAQATLFAGTLIDAAGKKATTVTGAIDVLAFDAVTDATDQLGATIYTSGSFLESRIKAANSGLTFDAAAIADLRSKNIYLERSIPISVPAPAQEATAEREREQRERDREKS
jgi:hypothetical protein